MTLFKSSKCQNKNHSRFNLEKNTHSNKSSSSQNIDHPTNNLFWKLDYHATTFQPIITSADLKTKYLLLYNLFQTTGFFYVFITLTSRGPKTAYGTYAAVGGTVSFLTKLQVLELAHCFLGLTKSNLLATILQLWSRTYICNLIVDYEPRLHKSVLVLVMFWAWSAAEIIRYPFYILQIQRIKNVVITWLRYTAWILLYPLGSSCEVIVAYTLIQFLHKNNKWYLEFTWPIAFTFGFLQVTQFCLYVVFGPSFVRLIFHMYAARKLKLGAKNQLNMPHVFKKL